MVVQLPPAVPPAPPSPSSDDVMETRTILRSAALAPLSLPYTGELEDPNLPHVLGTHNVFWSQTSFFISSEMESGGNTSAAVERTLQGLGCLCFPPELCFLRLVLCSWRLILGSWDAAPPSRAEKSTLTFEPSLKATSSCVVNSGFGTLPWTTATCVASDCSNVK